MTEPDPLLAKLDRIIDRNAVRWQASRDRIAQELREHRARERCVCGRELVTRCGVCDNDE